MGSLEANVYANVYTGLYCPQLEMVCHGILLGRKIVTTARKCLNYYKI